jgi:arylsulfatase A-like enzyme
MFWHFGQQWALRQGDWKLLYKVLDTTESYNPKPLPKEDTYFLVNLAEDMAERHNLASKFPDKVKAMLAIAHLKLAEK